MNENFTALLANRRQVPKSEKASEKRQTIYQNVYQNIMCNFNVTAEIARAKVFFRSAYALNHCVDSYKVLRDDFLWAIAKRFRRNWNVGESERPRNMPTVAVQRIIDLLSLTMKRITGHGNAN